MYSLPFLIGNSRTCVTATTVEQIVFLRLSKGSFPEVLALTVATRRQKTLAVETKFHSGGTTSGSRQNDRDCDPEHQTVQTRLNSSRAVEGRGSVWKRAREGQGRIGGGLGKLSPTRVDLTHFLLDCVSMMF